MPRRSVVKVLAIGLICLGLFPTPSLAQVQLSQNDPLYVRALSGDAEAQYAVGNKYYTGNGVSRNFSEAVKWLTLSASQGYATAQSDLGVMYSEGYGVPVNQAEALKWFRLAAGQGFPNAQAALGIIHYFGKGVPVDTRIAMMWLTQAAESNYAPAQHNIALIILNESGEQGDLEEAKKWLNLAAAQGYEKSQKLIDEIEAREATLVEPQSRADRPRVATAEKYSEEPTNVSTAAQDRAHANCAAQNIADCTDEKTLYDLVRTIPASQASRNAAGYARLIELNPANDLYRRKYAHYSAIVNGSSVANTRVANPSNSSATGKYDSYTNEIVLYEIVRKLPASRVADNAAGYARLMELNPESSLYRAKHQRYSFLLNRSENTNSLSNHDPFVRDANGGDKGSGVPTGNSNLSGGVVELTDSDGYFWNSLLNSRKVDAPNTRPDAGEETLGTIGRVSKMIGLTTLFVLGLPFLLSVVFGVASVFGGLWLFFKIIGEADNAQSALFSMVFVLGIPFGIVYLLFQGWKDAFTEPEDSYRHNLIYEVYHSQQFANTRPDSSDLGDWRDIVIEGDYREIERLPNGTVIKALTGASFTASGINKGENSVIYAELRCSWADNSGNQIVESVTPLFPDPEISRDLGIPPGMKGRLVGSEKFPTKFQAHDWISINKSSCRIWKDYQKSFTKPSGPALSVVVDEAASRDQYAFDTLYIKNISSESVRFRELGLDCYAAPMKFAERHIPSRESFYIDYGDTPYRLGPGESIKFIAQDPHRWFKGDDPPRSDLFRRNWVLKYCGALIEK